MSLNRSTAVTALLSLAVAGVAWLAWDYARLLLGMILLGPVQAFVFEFRFMVSLIAALAVVWLAEILIDAVARAWRRRK